MTTIRVHAIASIFVACAALPATNLSAQTLRTLPWDQAREQLGIASTSISRDTRARSADAPRRWFAAFPDTARANQPVVTRQTIVRNGTDDRVECPMPIAHVDSARVHDIRQSHVDTERFAPPAPSMAYCVNPLRR